MDYETRPKGFLNGEPSKTQLIVFSSLTSYYEFDLYLKKYNLRLKTLFYATIVEAFLSKNN